MNTDFYKILRFFEAEGFREISVFGYHYMQPESRRRLMTVERISGYIYLRLGSPEILLKFDESGKSLGMEWEDE